MTRAAWALALLVGLTACAQGGEEAGAAAPIGASGMLEGRTAGDLPERFGIGRAATEDEIAAVDIDIMPDGRGLPPGSGNVQEGARLYAEQCAICHGAELEGTPLAARLVPDPEHPGFPDGEDPPSFRTIGNFWPYATTLFDYVRRAMPFDRPGSLTDEEVYALTAYLLWRNGIIEEGTVMDATTLPAVVMPARDRFVVDDRLESDRVR